MATIEIGNLYSKLTGASNSAIRSVDEALAVETPNATFNAYYRSGRWDGMTRFYSVATGKFPTGLLSKVIDALVEVGERFQITEEPLPNSINVPDRIDLLPDITLRDYQYDSVVKGIKEQRGVVNVATNGGKTEIACGLIQCLLPTLKNGQRIVFFVHSKEIFSQSHKRLEKRLGIAVGKIGDGLWEEEPVTVAMIPTLSKYLSDKKIPKNQDADKFKAKVKQCKKFLDSISIFLADEVHHASSDTWYKLFMKLENAKFRYGLTGTVDESDQINLNRLYGSTGGIITKISNKFLIEQGYSAKPTIYMMSIKSKSVLGDYQEQRRGGIIENTQRNMVFMNKLQERENSGKRCLIIVNETEHGDVISGILDSMGIEHMFTHGDKSSKYRDESLSKLADGTLRVLIATSVLDEGVDVSGINCLFLLAGGKSMRQLLQRIGRGLRKKEDGSGIEVYDALDYHGKYLVEHTLERYNTYKSEGFDVLKI